MINRYRCGRMDCDDEYTGESSRTFGESFKEYLKATFPIYHHCNTTGHTITIGNFSIMGREDQNLARIHQKSIYIRVNSPSLNKSIGKCHLPQIWDEVLVKCLRTQIKKISPFEISGYSICHFGITFAYITNGGFNICHTATCL